MSIGTRNRGESIAWSEPAMAAHELGGVSLRRPAASSRIGEVRGPDASLRRNAILRLLLAVADAAAVLGAVAIAAALSPHGLRPTWAWLAAPAIVLAGAKLGGLYDRDEALLHKTTLDETPALFQLATLCALLVWLAAGVASIGELDARGALAMWLALTALLVLARAAARQAALRLVPVERCLVIGDQDAAAAIGSRLGRHGGVNAELVAQLDIEMAAPWYSETLSAHKLAEIGELARSMDVQRAIIAPGWETGEAPVTTMLDLIRTLEAVGVRVSVLPRLLEVVGCAVEFDDLHGVTVMGVKRFDLSRSSTRVKHALDVLGASLGLLALAPAILAIAAAIKLNDGGPVFFGQLRVGRHGRRFRMLKFRTMVPDADALKDALRQRNEARGGLFKIADDPRVTRIGRLLRKSALDELPQLLNIVKGEMSLVGPRPLVIDEDERIAGWRRRRLELMPGMTGPWQILGPARVPLDEMVAIDYLYVANWSLWGDIKILLRTVPHVVARRGL